MTDAWQGIDRYLAAKGVRVGAPTLGQTTGGEHAKGSYHYRGLARDYGRSKSDMPAIITELLPFAVGPDHRLAELFGSSTYWKDGGLITPSKGLFHAHQDHVHVALRPGAQLPKPAKAVPPLEVKMNAPDVPDITGPVVLHVIVDQAGHCTGYYVISPTTGEIHAYGPGAPFYGRSEVTKT